MLVQPIHRLGALLQEQELRARQDRLRLAERLDFLVAGLLPDVEVLQREVARPCETATSSHHTLHTSSAYGLHAAKHAEFHCKVPKIDTRNEIN